MTTWLSFFALATGEAYIEGVSQHVCERASVDVEGGLKVEIETNDGAMHTEMAASGAVIAIARGLDQALDILDKWGAFLPADRKDDAA